MPREKGESERDYALRLGFTSYTALQNHLAGVGQKAYSTSRSTKSGNMKESERAAKGEKPSWDYAVEKELTKLEKRSKK